MHAHELLTLCSRRGVTLAVHNGKLQLKDPQKALSTDERTLLQRHRRALIRALSCERSPLALAGAWEHRELLKQNRETVPLTPYQGVFHLLSRNEESLAVVNQAGAFELDNLPKDSEASSLRHALSALMRRHDMLRAAIITPAGGEPFQRIASECDIPFSVRVLSDAGEREAAIADTIKGYRFTPYDLANPPLWRAALFPYGDGRATLVLGFHHLIMDGWSMGVLVRDLVTLLAREQGEENATLPELPSSYAEYASWLCGHGLPLVETSQTCFWRNTLNGVPDRHTLPLDFHRSVPQPEEKKPEQGLCRAVLGPDSMRKAGAWAARHGCSLFSALHTALRVLLYRESGDTAAPVLTVAANRQLTGQENMVGCFVNVLPLTSELDTSQPVAQALSQSRECLMDALDNQTLPFQNIVAATGSKRHPSRHPISQVFLTIQNAFETAGGIQADPRLPDYPISAYDLAFIMWDLGDKGLAVHLEYDGGLFHRGHMEYLLQGFLECLNALPDQENNTPDTIRLETLTAIPAPSYAVSNHEDAEVRRNAAARLAELLGLKAYDSLTLENKGIDPQGLFTLAATLSGLSVTFGTTPTSGNTLTVLSHWPTSDAGRDKSDRILVNHLPPASFLHARFKEAPRLLLQLPGTLVFVLADPKSIQSGNETHLVARSHPADLPPSIRPGNTLLFSTETRLRALGQDCIALPLPGGASPLLWRDGQAVNLDILAAHLPERKTDLALGLAVPVDTADSLLLEDGELVVWHVGATDEGLYDALPSALRPTHRMRLTQLPRRTDGALVRDALSEMSLYASGILERAMNTLSRPGLELTKGNPTPRVQTDLFEPRVDGRFLKPVFSDTTPPSDWNAPFAADRFCLVTLSGSATDTERVSLLLRYPEARICLCGSGAEMLCREMDAPDRLFSCGTRTDTRNDFRDSMDRGRAVCGVPAGGLVHLLDDDGFHSGSSSLIARVDALNKVFHDAFPGTAILHWLAVNQDKAPERHYAGPVFNELCAYARRYNASAPHACLTLAMPANTTTQASERWLTFSEEQAFSTLSAALQSGLDTVLAGADPETVIRKGFWLHDWRPTEQLLINGRSGWSPHLLPHPLRNAWGETGPYTVNESTLAESSTRPVDIVENPRPDVQSELAAIWSKVLGTDNPDPDANFFDLGGTSIMAPQLRESIEQAFHVDIGVAGVFLYPSLRELTGAVLDKLPGEKLFAAQETTREHSLNHEENRATAQRNARQKRKQQASIHA